MVVLFSNTELMALRFCVSLSWKKCIPFSVRVYVLVFIQLERFYYDLCPKEELRITSVSDLPWSHRVYVVVPGFCCVCRSWGSSCSMWWPLSPHSVPSSLLPKKTLNRKGLVGAFGLLSPYTGGLSKGLLSVELCPPKRFMQVLTPRTSERNLIWK